MNPRRTTTALAAATLALGLTACSTSVDPDEMALEYNAPWPDHRDYNPAWSPA
jgi:hypothetical protein